MARLPRYFAPDQPLHIVQRGNNRAVIFAAPEDYTFYLEHLEEAAKKHGLAIHTYALMTNHVHLLATPSHADSLPKTMQSVGRSYVQYFNYRYQRTGTLFEGRYRATLIDSDAYLFTCMRYIELNPVRAGMVSDAAAYPWSGYHHNVIERTDALITPHGLYQQLGATNMARGNAYRQFFEVTLPEEELEAIRSATNKGWALGNARFQAEVAELTGRRSVPIPRGRPRKIS